MREGCVRSITVRSSAGARVGNGGGEGGKQRLECGGDVEPVNGRGWEAVVEGCTVWL